MTNAVFLINPLSYSVIKRGSILEKSALSENVLRYNLDPFGRLPHAIDEIVDKNVEFVFIEGGDGTVHGVLSAFLNRKDDFNPFPKFILLPGGMTNLVAGHVGIKKPTPAKIEAILLSPETVKTSELPLLKIQYETHKYNGFLFSTGALPKGTRYCLDKIHTRGISGASAVRTTLLRVLLGRGEERETILGPTPMCLEINEQKIEDDHILTLTTTLPSLMIGLAPFWGTGNGSVRISHVRKGAKRLVGNVIRLLKSQQSDNNITKLKRDGFQSWSADKVVMHHAGPLVLDGEFLPQTTGPITLSASLPLTFISHS